LNKESDINSLRRGIIRTLAYYDIFSYPLTASEVFQNLRENHSTVDKVTKELDDLCLEELIYRNGDYYLLTNDNNYINRRNEGKKIAEKRLKTARRVSSFISRFPFIRGILLSGSISKGFMENNSDIDYFVVTYPNRVWFSRLMLMIFKKIFLLNSKKIFCINYFVDLENLEIEEKNIFTATELVTLLPMYGKDVYEELYSRNMWMKEFYPNFPRRETKEILNRNTGLFKSLLEKLFGNKIGDKIDDFAMALFDKFNKSKYKDYDQDEFKIAFKSSKKESKHHPKFFQKKVLQEFDRRIKSLEDSLRISLQ